VLDTSPDSKYSQNHVESKTRGPYVSERRDDVTETKVCPPVMISCNSEVLGQCFCGGYHNMVMKISIKANDGPLLNKLIASKIHSITPTSAAKNVAMKIRSLFEH